EWTRRNAGEVIFSPDSLRATQIQLRPDVASPRALLDVRVRQALARSLDKKALTEGLLGDDGIPADTMMVPTSEYFLDLDRTLAKYPYDLREAERLLGQAGYTRGAGGSYVDSTGERFALQLQILGGSQNESEAGIMADAWNRAGLNVETYVLPRAQQQD